MTNQPPLIDLALAKRRRAGELLRPIMASDPVLQDYHDLLDVEYIFSATYRGAAGPTKPTRDWVDGQKHLAVFQVEATGKFAILCFEVLSADISQASVGIEDVVIEFSLYSHITHVDAQPYVIHVVSPGDGQPIRCRLHVGRLGARALYETSDISVSDLVDRFSGQVENILGKIAFIAEIIMGLESYR
jgi:hypothetical protein